MTARILLRALAIVIAIAALVDPIMTRDVPGRRPLRVVITQADDMQHAERLVRRLSADYDVTIHDADPSSSAAACPSTGGCILVSRGDVPRRLTAGATVIGALRVTAENARGVIRRIQAPLTVHRDAAASVRTRAAAAVCSCARLRWASSASSRALALTCGREPLVSSDSETSAWPHL